MTCVQVEAWAPEWLSRMGHCPPKFAAKCGQHVNTARELHFTERPSAQIHSDFMGAGGEIRTLDLLCTKRSHPPFSESPVSRGRRIFPERYALSVS
jgi:hypothetical protein